MMTNICFGLVCMLIPLVIELLSLQAQLQLSKPGHALIEIMIVAIAWWLILQILRWDERLYLQNLNQQNRLASRDATFTVQSEDHSSISVSGR